MMSNPLKDMISKAGAAAGGAASTAITAVSKAGAAVAEAIPSKAAVLRNVGEALIVGGKLLIDPRSTVGEIAVSLGTTLVGDNASPEWLVLEAGDSGFLPVFRGPEEACREAYTAAASSGKALVLCQVLAAQPVGPKI